MALRCIDRRLAGGVASLSGVVFLRPGGAALTRSKTPQASSRRVSPDQLQRSRVSLIRRATLLVDGKSEDLLIIDLALNGVFVEREKPLPKNSRARVSFQLPGNELSVEAECRVAWLHSADGPLRSKQLPSGLGLEFVEIAEDDARRLRLYLEEHFGRAPRARQFTRPWVDEDEEPEFLV